MLSSITAPARAEAAKWRRSWVRGVSTPATLAALRAGLPKSHSLRSCEIALAAGSCLRQENILVASVAR